MKIETTNTNETINVEFQNNLSEFLTSLLLRCQLLKNIGEHFENNGCCSLTNVIPELYPSQNIIRELTKHYDLDIDCDKEDVEKEWSTVFEPVSLMLEVDKEILKQLNELLSLCIQNKEFFTFYRLLPMTVTLQDSIDILTKSQKIVESDFDQNVKVMELQRWYNGYHNCPQPCC